jgi:uncharacterized membrane protein YagU involved in acid resistance
MIAYDLSSVDLETICRALGLLGFAIYVVAFFCLSMGKLTSTRPLYFTMVLIASSCVLASLWADFNLSAALIQGFYIAMSLGAILLRTARPAPAPARVPPPVPTAVAAE